MESKVKPRFDNAGTEFGLVHRLLPRKCYMTDIDAIMYRSNTNTILEIREDTTFIEYRLNDDNIEFKAIFEVKKRLTNSVRNALKLKPGTSLYALKVMSEKLNCRLFLVISNKGKPPFRFIEIYHSGKFETVGYLNYNNTNKKEKIISFWQKLGLL